MVSKPEKKSRMQRGEILLVKILGNSLKKYINVVKKSVSRASCRHAGEYYREKIIILEHCYRNNRIWYRSRKKKSRTRLVAGMPEFL